MLVYAERMTAVERAETRVALLKEAAALAEDLRANAAAREELLKRRVSTCKALRAHGVPIADIQDVLRLSRGRIHQILRGPGRNQRES